MFKLKKTKKTMVVEQGKNLEIFLQARLAILFHVRPFVPGEWLATRFFFAICRIWSATPLGSIDELPPGENIRHMHLYV